MKLNLAKKVTGIDGKALMKSQDEQWTMRSILIEAFVTDVEADRKSPGAKKFERWQFADRISKADSTIILTVEEVAETKERAGMTCPTILVGWLYTEIEESNG